MRESYPKMNRIYFTVASLFLIVAAYVCTGLVSKESTCGKIVAKVETRNSVRDVSCRSYWLGGITMFVENEKSVTLNDINDLNLSYIEKYFSFPAEVFVGNSILSVSQPTFRFILGHNNSIEKTGPHPADA
jgi:hypothetical protein